MWELLGRELGRRLSVDVHYLMHNGIWVSLRYFVVSLLGFVTTVIFTRLASPELYGTYQFIIALAAFFSFLSLPGLNIAALKAVVQGNQRAVFQVVRLSFFSALLGIPLILGYALYGYRIGGENLPWSVLVLTALAFPFFYALNTWYTYYEGRKEFFSVSWRAILIPFITLVGILIGLLTDMGLMALVAIYFGTAIALSLIFLWEVAKKNPGRALSEAILDVPYGLAVTVQKFVYGLSELLPPILVGIVFGYDDLAFFQIAFFLFSAVSGYMGALAAMYYPKFFEGTSLKGTRMITHNLLGGLLIALGMSVFLWLFFPLLYSDEYALSMHIAWTWVPLSLLLPLKSYLLTYFTAQKRNRLLIMTYLAANVFSFSIFLMTKNYGLLLSASVYIASLTLTTTLPLTLAYFLSASRKTDSI